MLFFISCIRNTETKNADLLQIKCENCKGDKDSEQLHYRTVKIIPFETNGNSLISNIQRLEIIDSLILIQDFQGASSKLLLFDQQGKYITQIGQFGNGPEEYISLKSFFINEKRGHVTIIDEMKSSFITYDLKGKFVSSIPIPLNNIKSANYALLTGDNKLLINYLISFEDNKAYSFMNNKNFTKIENIFNYYPIEVSGYMYPFSDHPMTKSDDGIDFIMPLSDTIFNFNKGVTKPKFLIETPSKIAPKEYFKTDIKNSYNYLLYEYSKKGYFPGFESIFETTHHILLNYKKDGIILGYYIANKKEQKGTYLLYTMNNKIEKVPFFEIKCSDPNYFIGVSSAQDLLNIRNQIKENDETMELNKIINNLKFDDNPVLFLYEIIY